MFRKKAKKIHDNKWIGNLLGQNWISIHPLRRWQTHNVKNQNVSNSWLENLNHTSGNGWHKNDILFVKFTSRFCFFESTCDFYQTTLIKQVKFGRRKIFEIQRAWVRIIAENKGKKSCKKNWECVFIAFFRAI